MRTNKRNKLFGIILIFLFVADAVFMYNQLTTAIDHSTAAATYMGKEYDPTFMILAFGILLIITIITFVLLFRAMASKVVVEKSIATTGQAFNLEDEETISLEEQEERQRQKEEEERKEIDAIVQKIITQIDSTDNLQEYAENLLQAIAHEFDAVQGIMFLKEDKHDIFNLLSTYAFYSEREIKPFEIGEGISGQVAKNRKFLNAKNIPEGYITILSGLGQSEPNTLFIFPVLYMNQSIGVIELASFEEFDERAEKIFMELSEAIGEHLTKMRQKDSFSDEIEEQIHPQQREIPETKTHTKTEKQEEKKPANTQEKQPENVAAVDDSGGANEPEDTPPTNDEDTENKEKVKYDIVPDPEEEDEEPETDNDSESSDDDDENKEKVKYDIVPDPEEEFDNQEEKENNAEDTPPDDDTPADEKKN